MSNNTLERIKEMAFTSGARLDPDEMEDGLSNIIQLCNSAPDGGNAGTNQCIMNGKVLRPIEYKVIVKPDLIEETDETLKRCKALGIELPEAEKERDKQRQITGTLIAVGGKAFEEFGDPMPKVGDKVYFAKYAGLVIKGDDKAEYRMMNDKDVTAVLV